MQRRLMMPVTLSAAERKSLLPELQRALNIPPARQASERLLSAATRAPGSPNVSASARLCFR